MLTKSNVIINFIKYHTYYDITEIFRNVGSCRTSLKILLPSNNTFMRLSCHPSLASMSRIIWMAHQTIPTTRCQFHQHFKIDLYVRKCFANFSLICFWIFFWQESIGAKAACKMLMKLTKGSRELFPANPKRRRRSTRCPC